MKAQNATRPDGIPSDETLIKNLAAGDSAAITPLYGRYAPLVFHLAEQSLGRSSAEDIVQDVFLTVWSGAKSFDPGKGGFKPWLLQIAHYKILNELRRRSRRPQLDPDVDAEILDELPDESAEPARSAWRGYQREAVRAAVERLPAAQRQALSLAFFEELTHDQVAAALKLPLGTVKTRIRSAMRTLRSWLAPVGAAVVILAALAGLGLRFGPRILEASRTERALTFVTASDVTTIHLSPAPGVPEKTHGSYRGREGSGLAVMALHFFPPAPEGTAYQGWILVQGKWISVGVAKMDSEGNAILIGEGAGFTTLPQAVEVTREPAAGSTAPTGPVMIHWN